MTPEMLRALRLNPRIRTALRGRQAALSAAVDDGNVDRIVKAAAAWAATEKAAAEDLTKKAGDPPLHSVRFSVPCDVDTDNDLDADGLCANLGKDDDGDALQDFVETGTGVFVSANDTGTAPDLLDGDGDGWDDGIEVSSGTDPNDPNDFPVAVPAIGLRGLGLLSGLLVGAAYLTLSRRAPKKFLRTGRSIVAVASPQRGPLRRPR